MRRRRRAAAGDRVNLIADPVVLTAFEHADSMVQLGAPNSYERTVGIVLRGIICELLALRREFEPHGAERFSDEDLEAWVARAQREGAELTERFLADQSEAVRRRFGVE